MQKTKQQLATGAGFTDPPEYLTKQQVARHLNVSTRTIDSMMRARKIGFPRITRKLVRFRKSDVDDYLEPVMDFGRGI